MAIWIGYRHADRLITYPYPHNLSISRQPIRMRSGYPPRLEHADLAPTTYPHAQRTPPAWRVPRGLRGVAVVPADGSRDAQQHARHGGTAQVPAGGGRAGRVIDQSERGSRMAISRAGHHPPAQPAAQRRAPRARRRERDTAHRHNQQLRRGRARAGHLPPAQPAARRNKTNNTVPEDEARHKPRDAEKPAGNARKSSPSVPCARAGASRPDQNGFGPRCAAPRLRCR